MSNSGRLISWAGLNLALTGSVFAGPPFLTDDPAAEMTAQMGRDPGEIYLSLTKELGTPVYDRVEALATAGQKEALKSFLPNRSGRRIWLVRKSNHGLLSAARENESRPLVKYE